MSDFASFIANLGLDAACLCNNGLSADWDGTLPAQFAPNNGNLRWQPAGSAGGIISDKNIVAPVQTRYVAVMEVFFHGSVNPAASFWEFIVNCLAGDCSTNAGTVWMGQKATGLTPVDQNGTFIRILGASNTPACCHFASF